MTPSKYTHSPFPHLNGSVIQPMSGNKSQVQPVSGSVLKGTNVGGNIVTRTINSVMSRFGG